MRNFLRLFQGSGMLRDLSSAVRSVLGDSLFQALCNHGLLQRGELADRYHGLSIDGTICSMKILPNPNNEQFPFLAVPVAPGEYSAFIKLTRAELATVVGSLPGLVLLLREMLDLVGESNLQVSPYPGSYMIGETKTGRLVVLSTSVDLPGFGAFLGDLSSMRCPTLTLALCRSPLLDPAVERSFCRGAHLELAFLEDILTLDRGAIVLVDGFESRQPKGETPTVCVAFTHRGELPLTLYRYREMLSHRDDFAMFLDVTAVVRGARYYGHKIDDKQVLTRCAVPKHGAHIVAEYVRCRGQALRPSDIPYVKVTKLRSCHKIIERVRRQLDMKIGGGRRYSSRSIHTRPGETHEATRYAFDPPPDLTYSVIVPLSPTA